MKELSLNILDIAENSAKANASEMIISLSEHEHVLTLKIIDNGCGMTPDIVKRLADPFYTTRTTRKVGLGVPLLTLAAEQTGGSVTIESRPESTHPDDHGTTVTAVFRTNHIDAPPLGDIISTIVTLIQGHPDRDFQFVHKSERFDVSLNTKEMREILGDTPLNTPDVLVWIGQSLREQYGIPEDSETQYVQ